MARVVRSGAASALVLAALGGGILFYRIGSLPFVGADEPRYARVAEEMQAAGRWATPTLEGRPWLEKPPLYYWLAIPAFAAFGVSEAAARAGPALAALGAAFAVWWAGRRWFGPEAGLYSAAIVLTSLGFVAFGRSASTDMPLAACLTAALALLGAAAVGPPLPRLAVLAAYTFLGLAVLAKGPVALVLAAGIGALFWWLDERGEALTRWRVLSGVLVAAAVSLPWFVVAFRENGFSFAAVFLINHNLARFVSDIHHHSEPAYYYVPVLAGLLLPWTGWFALLAPLGRFRPGRPLREEERAVLWLVSWAALPLLFFSLSRAKLPGYILPVLPPMALLLGRRMAAAEANHAVPRAAAWSFVGVAAAAAAALPFVFQARYGLGWPAGITIGAALGLPALAAFAAALRGRLRAAWLLTALAGLLVVAALAHLAFPGLAAYHSGRDVARAAVALREGTEPLATYRWFHHTFHYYTGYSVAADLETVEELDRFALEHPRFLVVIRADRMDEARAATGFAAQPLARQGDLVLARMTHPK